MHPSDEFLARHFAFVASDNQFQRRARLLQAIWREEQGLPIGEHRGRPLGSRLAMPAAKDTLSNYLSNTIRNVVRREVLDPVRSAGKLFSQPRIWCDLLSSQPMAFNLFAHLQQDLELASRVFHRMTDGRIDRVTAIQFEHSPGRRDLKYTGDRSAFDVFIEYATAENGPGFLGIEVKFHEGMNDQPAEHRPRYDEIAAGMKCFHPEACERLKQTPIQQVWRDHLLAGSLLHHPEGPYRDGFFAFLYPSGNENCARAVELYGACLTAKTSFVPWTIRVLVEAIKAERGGGWVDAFASRYLAFEKVEALADPVTR